MPKRYAKGKFAVGECARSGRKMLLKDMVSDGYYPSLIVDPDWYEGKHPQESLPEIEDPVALWRPAPERDLVGALLALDNANQVTYGYQLGQPAFSIETGLEFIESGPVTIQTPVNAAAGFNVTIPGVDTQVGDLAILFAVAEQNNSPVELRAGSQGFNRAMSFADAADTLPGNGGGIMWKQVRAADIGATLRMGFFTGVGNQEIHAWVWTFRKAAVTDAIENVVINYVQNWFDTVGNIGDDPEVILPAPIRIDGVPNGGVIQGWMSGEQLTFTDARETAPVTEEINTAGMGTFIAQFQPAIADTALNNLIQFRTLTEPGAAAFFTAVACVFTQIDWDNTGSITDSLIENGGVEEHGFDFTISLTAGLTYVYALTVKRTLDNTGTTPDAALIRVDDGANPVFGEWYGLQDGALAGGPALTVGAGFNHASYHNTSQGNICIARIIPTVSGNHTFEIRTGEPTTTLSHAPIPLVSPDKSLQVIGQSLYETNKMRTNDYSPGVQSSALKNTFGEFLDPTFPNAREYLAFALTIKAETGSIRRVVGADQLLNPNVDTNRPEFANGTPNNPTLAIPLAPPYEVYYPGAYGNQSSVDDNNTVYLDLARRGIGKHFFEIVIEAGGNAGDPSPAGVASPTFSVGWTAVDRRPIAPAGDLTQSWGYRNDGTIEIQGAAVSPDDPWFPAVALAAGQQVVFSFAADFDNGFCWFYIDGVYAGDLNYGREGESGSQSIGPQIGRMYSPYVTSLDATTPLPAKYTFRVLQSQFSSVFSNSEIANGGFIPWDVGPGYTPSNTYSEADKGWLDYYDNVNEDPEYVFTNFPTMLNVTQSAASGGGFTNAMIRSIGRYTGQIYWEVTVNTVGVLSSIGFGGWDHQQEREIGSASATHIRWYGLLNSGVNRGFSGIVSAGYGNGDVVGVALDIDAATVEYFVNGVSQGTSNPITSFWRGFGYLPMVTAESTGTTGDMTINLGDTAFAFAPPAGHVSFRSSFALPGGTEWQENPVAGTGWSRKPFTSLVLTGNGLVSSADRLTVSDSTLGASFLPTISSGIGRYRGRWYWEITVVDVGTGTLTEVRIGAGNLGTTSTAQAGTGSGSVAHSADGEIRSAGVAQATSAAPFTTGDVVSVLLDFTAAYFTTWVNGVPNDEVGIRNNGNSGLTGNFNSFPFMANAAGSMVRPILNCGRAGDGVSMRANFGGSPFIYSDLLPEGYFAYDDITQANPL